LPTVVRGKPVLVEVEPSGLSASHPGGAAGRRAMSAGAWMTFEPLAVITGGGRDGLELGDEDADEPVEVEGGGEGVAKS
jgi:hypothetical protein